MASNAFSGATGSVTVGAAISEIKNWKITPKADTKDATNMSSAGWHEVKTCLRGWGGTFLTEVYPGDICGSQAVATFALGTGTPAGATGTSKSYVGTVNIETTPVTVPHDDLITWEVSFTGNGPLTIS